MGFPVFEQVVARTDTDASDAGGWLLAASSAIVGVLLAFPATACAQCSPLLYDFNTLVPGLIEGQDGWVRRAPPNNAGLIQSGAGIDSSIAYRTTTDQSGAQGASRALPQLFRYSAASGTTTWSLQATMTSSGGEGNRDAHAGLMFHDQAEQMLPLVTFGLWQCNFGCTASRTTPSAYLQTNNLSLSNDGGVVGSPLAFSHWYEFRLSIDWTQTGGRGTLQYRDLTLGQQAFVSDAALTDVPLGLVPSVSGEYTAYYVAARMDQTGGTSTLDNLQFGAPQSVVFVDVGPTNTATCQAGTASFAVLPGGSGPFSFQWRKGGVPIDTNTNPTAATAALTLTNVLLVDADLYDCVVINACGSITSNPATLSICPADMNCDGGVDISDLLSFLSAFEAGSFTADLDNGTNAGTPDNAVDINDLLFFLARFEAGC